MTDDAFYSRTTAPPPRSAKAGEFLFEFVRGSDGDRRARRLCSGQIEPDAMMRKSNG